MGRIVIPGEPEEPDASYGDESYADNIKADAVTVMAQFPNRADLTWYFALIHQMRRSEVKYRQFRNAQNALPTDLVRRVFGGFRGAVVAISDDRSDKASMQRRLEAIARKPIAKLDGHVQRYFANVINEYADDMVLMRSPLYRLEGFLGGAELAAIRDHTKALN